MSSISFIIPVYNVGDFVEKTIDSILGNVEVDFEVILINDGSTDNTHQMISKFKSDTRFTIVNQENRGVSFSRNLGIDLAKKDYIYFLDGDDIFDLNVTSDFFEKNFDLLVGNRMHLLNRELISVSDFHEDVRSTESFLNECIRDEVTFWNIGGYFIRAAILKENRLYFDYQYASAEDLDFFMKIISLIEKVYITSSNLFIYRIGRAGSAMSTYSEFKIYNQLDVCKKYFYLYRNDSVISEFFAQKFWRVLSDVGYLDRADNIGRIEEIVNSVGTDMSKTRKNILVYQKIFSILGIRNGSKLIVKIRKIRK